MSHDDDAGEDLLAGVDLHKWQVPPPPTGQRAAVLVRALAPARPAKRRNIAWILAAIVIANAAIATIIALVVVPRSSAPTQVVARPAGGPTVEHLQQLLDKLEAERQRLVQRLEEEQRELQRRLVELEQLRTVTAELTEKLRRFEDKEKLERPTPTPSPKRDENPFDSPGCDEVGCVLDNYRATCCAKFRRGAADRVRQTLDRLPEGLDRAAISTAIAAVKDKVRTCATRSTAKGKVKVKVQVLPSGSVGTVVVEVTPDAWLGMCVANAVQKAKFAATRHGGSFSYPFVF